MVMEMHGDGWLFPKVVCCSCTQRWSVIICHHHTTDDLKAAQPEGVALPLMLPSRIHLELLELIV